MFRLLRPHDHLHLGVSGSSTASAVTAAAALVSRVRCCATAAASSASSSPTPEAAPKQAETAEQLSRRLRKETDREVYEPGALAKGVRAVLVGATSALGLQQRVARRMERGLKEVERLEKEHKWLKTHGSPLRVLGLPETADLEDIKVRYRNLLFEVHPDTAPRADGRALVAAAGLTEQQVRDRQMAEFDLLKTAYAIATSPNSLWHQDGNAPTLLRELQGPVGFLSRVITPHNAFPVIAYLYGFAVAFFFFSVVTYYVLMAMLEAADPDFFKFMMGQESEERRKREAGEVVDTNPKRLVPAKMMRISAPGKFVNNAAMPDEDEFDDGAAAAAATGALRRA